MGKSIDRKILDRKIARAIIFLSRILLSIPFVALGPWIVASSACFN